ncbi:MAG: DUF6695 family protein [Flavobacteriales bacterium]
MCKPKNISEKAQLLKGLYSSWFEITEEEREFRIKRYSEKGKLECDRIFTTDTDFDINKDYKFTYISHCKECNIIQNGTIITFKTTDYEY